MLCPHVSAATFHGRHTSRQQCQALYLHSLFRDFQGASMNAARHQMSALSHHGLSNSDQDEVCRDLSFSHKTTSSGSHLCQSTVKGTCVSVANYANRGLFSVDIRRSSGLLSANADNRSAHTLKSSMVCFLFSQLLCTPLWIAHCPYSQSVWTVSSPCPSFEFWVASSPENVT